MAWARLADGDDLRAHMSMLLDALPAGGRASERCLWQRCWFCTRLRHRRSTRRGSRRNLGHRRGWPTCTGTNRQQGLGGGEGQQGHFAARP